MRLLRRPGQGRATLLRRPGLVVVGRRRPASQTQAERTPAGPSAAAADRTHWFGSACSGVRYRFRNRPTPHLRRIHGFLGVLGRFGYTRAPPAGLFGARAEYATNPGLMYKAFKKIISKGGSMQALAQAREEEFIGDVMRLGRHYDKGIGYTRFKGGALQVQGFRIFKLRRWRRWRRPTGAFQLPARLAARTRSRWTMWTACRSSCTLTTLPTARGGSGAQVGGRRRERPEGVGQDVQVGSAAVRDLMASKVLDIWVRDGELCIWVIPPSQITNGLFEQTQKAAPGTSTRRPWPAQPGRRGRSSRSPERRHCSGPACPVGSNGNSRGSAQSDSQRWQRRQQRARRRPRSQLLGRRRPSTPKRRR